MTRAPCRRLFKDAGGDQLDHSLGEAGLTTLPSTVSPVTRNAADMGWAFRNCRKQGMNRSKGGRWVSHRRVCSFSGLCPASAQARCSCTFVTGRSKMSFARDGAGVAPHRSQQSNVQGRGETKRGRRLILTLQEVPGEDTGFCLLTRGPLSLTLLVFVN